METGGWNFPASHSAPAASFRFPAPSRHRSPTRGALRAAVSVPQQRFPANHSEWPDPAYQPSKAELEEDIRVPAISMEEADRRLLRPVEIIRTEKPPSQSR